MTKRPAKIFADKSTTKTPQELGQELLKELQSDNCDAQKALALIAQGAAVDEKSKTGSTALMWAAVYGRTDIVRALLERGAAIDEKNNDGNTALMWAAANGHTDIARTLLDRGAAVDEKDNAGMTALMWAEDNDHQDVEAMIRAEAERRRLAEEAAMKAAEDHAAWMRAGMPVVKPAAMAPLKLKKRGLQP